MLFATIDNRRFAYQVSGTGSQIVILETGLGAESDEWSEVEQRLVDESRVFRYDRLGRGRSQAADRPRTTREMVDDLHALLDKANVHGPYIFVGHSFGGMIGRLFAASFPGEVSALVLVEAVHREQFSVLGPLFPEPTSHDAPALVAMREFWLRGWQVPETTPEKIEFEKSFDIDAEIAGLGALPIEVITGDTFLTAPFLSRAEAERLQTAWLKLQSEFLGLSDGAKQTKADGSGHFVQRDKPDVISRCVKSLQDQSK